MAAPRAREGKRQDPEAEGSEFVEEDLFNQYRPVRGRNNKGLADDATATAPCVTGFCVLQEFSSSIGHIHRNTEKGGRQRCCSLLGLTDIMIGVDKLG